MNKEEILNTDGYCKRMLVPSGNGEYDVPNPSMYVTKVINPEREIKKRIMAKQLESELREQIEARKRLKEEEHKNRLLEEREEEEKLRKEREELEQEQKNEKLKEMKKSKGIQNEEFLPNEAPLQTIEIVKPKIASQDKYQYRKHDMQLARIRNQIVEKEKEFNTELEKLKVVANATNNTGQMFENQLSQLEKCIVNRQQCLPSSIPPFESRTIERYSKAKIDHYTGIGKYGKFYLNNYDKPFAIRDEKKGKYNAQDDYLSGESKLIPFEDKSKAKTMNTFLPGRLNYDRLNNIMVELEDKDKYGAPN